MSGVYDRLNKRLGIESQEGGISPLDLADLPPLHRKIMRYLLREHELLASEIQEWAADWPAAEREQLEPALETLTKQFWLIRRGEGERVRYQANLRRRAGSKLAQGIWNALDEKINANAQKKDPGE